MHATRDLSTRIQRGRHRKRYRRRPRLESTHGLEEQPVRKEIGDNPLFSLFYSPIIKFPWQVFIFLYIEIFPPDR